MSSVDWKRVRPLLARLLELPEDEHDAFLEEACGDDPELARTAKRLFTEDREGGSFLAGPFQDPVAGSTTLSPGESVGAWTVERPLGSGGMGEVWLATRADLGQSAALKVVRHGLASAEVLERFERERRLLASLEHPGVARLLDGGALANGRPWLAMEFVEGQRIDAFCRERRLDVRERVELFLQVLDAVGAAHRQLVCTATSSRRTCWSRRTGSPGSSTSGSPRSWRRRATRR